jgi:hypothetical protein
LFSLCYSNWDRKGRNGSAKDAKYFQHHHLPAFTVLWVFLCYSNRDREGRNGFFIAFFALPFAFFAIRFAAQACIAQDAMHFNRTHMPFRYLFLIWNYLPNLLDEISMLVGGQGA